MRMKEVVELTTNVALTIAAVAVTAAMGWRLWTGSNPSVAAAPPVPPGYAIGEQLPAIEGIRYQESARTVILFASSQCKFCTESMPYYSRLSESKNSHRGMRFVIAGPEPEAVLRRYVEGHDVRPDQVMNVKPGVFKVTGTPTLIVADSAGKVLGYWRGLLGDREAEVETALQ